jgi:hypothetical protein
VAALAVERPGFAEGLRGVSGGRTMAVRTVWLHTGQRCGSILDRGHEQHFLVAPGAELALDL